MCQFDQADASATRVALLRAHAHDCNACYGFSVVVDACSCVQCQQLVFNVVTCI